MKKLILITLFLVTATAVAQLSYPVVDQQIRSEMSSSNRHDNDRSSLALTTGYTGFSIDNIARQGFNIDIQAFVARVSPVRIAVNAGVVFYNSSSSPAQSPLSSPLYSQAEYYYSEYYAAPRFSLNFAMAYVGGDAVYYFSEGKVRPYVAAGIEGVTWQMNQGYAAAILPTTRAGVEVAVKSSLTGFGEVRYMYGTRNLLTPYPSSLGYVTTVAFGVSFAPQL